MIIFPSEFKEVKETHTADRFLGDCGRMIHPSKGEYRYNNPNNAVIFNSNICTEDEKIWYGDIDLTLDESKLILLAIGLGKKIYVLHENDARFGSEKKINTDKASYWTDGRHTGFKEYFTRGDDGRVVVAPPAPLTEEEKGRINKHKEERRASFKKENFRSVLQIQKEDIKSTKRTSPLEAFYRLVTKTLGVPYKDFDVTVVYVTENTDDFLKDLFFNWAKKNNPGLSEYKLKSSVSMEWFAYGPATFGEGSTPDWAEDFIVYTRRKQ